MAQIPTAYRAALSRALTQLIDGYRPDLLTWVHTYGADGATLVEQPEEIWSHPGSELVERPDGTAWVVLPLWTTEEEPSDLSAEIEISHSGEARITDVHVL